ncbi:SGNH/GDSL hydrolase family protein [Bradyrhizobium yuanmingense]|uniref:SGNH/GDSL hydrolase family protein n=1 Tax=Bradyrhizobium yuanmingense TaxID=108015 RepID=UPI003D2F0A61
MLSCKPHPMSLSLKILALGTSLTATPLWVERLRTDVQNCAGRDVEIEVVARNGANSRWGLSQIQHVIDAKPDVVTIEFAVNDASLRHLVSLGESRKNHENIIALIRRALPAAKIVLFAVSPTWGARGVWIRPWLTDYYALYPRLADTLQVSFVDARPAWDKYDAGSAIPDGLHPTGQAMSEFVAPVLAKAICSSAS